MPVACAALRVLEVVEQIVSFFPLFEQAAPLAGVCTWTKIALWYPLQEHAYLVRLCEEHENAVWLEQIQYTELQEPGQQQNATPSASLQNPHHDTARQVWIDVDAAQPRLPHQRASDGVADMHRSLGVDVPSEPHIWPRNWVPALHSTVQASGDSSRSPRDKPRDETRVIGRRSFRMDNIELVCGCRCGCVTCGARRVRCTSCSRLLSTSCRCLVDWLGNLDHAVCHVCEEESEARAIERCNEAGEECRREYHQK